MNTMRLKRSIYTILAWAMPVVALAAEAATAPVPVTSASTSLRFTALPVPATKSIPTTAKDASRYVMPASKSPVG